MDALHDDLEPESKVRRLNKCDSLPSFVQPVDMAGVKVVAAVAAATEAAAAAQAAAEP